VTTLFCSHKAIPRDGEEKRKEKKKTNLQESDGSTQLSGLGLVRGVLHLVGNVLEPIMSGLNVTSHMGKLVTNDGVVDKTLTESLSLVSVLEGLLKADASKAVSLDDDTNSTHICHQSVISITMANRKLPVR
jgi:hypothetical protein